MPEHQRADSQAVIDALASLGQALGYAATPEWPIPADTHPPPAVDVVWLRRPEDSSPLFAFEVESFAKQGMSDNALKLMSRPSAELPKPLHFAQVILNGGQRSHRTADLARQFAAHNYDVYSLSGDGEEARLLRDVLNAHHRVRGEVDLFDFAEALRDCPWGDDVVDEALLHVELVGFDAAYTTDYASLGRRDPYFLRHLARHVRCELRGESPAGVAYDTFTGGWFSIPLHLAILAVVEPESAVAAFDALRTWQGGGVLRQLGAPHGRNMDYDEFMMTLAPYLMAVLAASMDRVEGGRAWCAGQMRDVLEGLSRADLECGAHTAVWLLHVSAADPGLADTYEMARAWLDERGGIDEEFLLAPPPSAPSVVHDPSEWDEILARGTVEVPPSADLISSSAPLEGAASLVDLALDQLLLHLPPEDSGRMLLPFLHSRQGRAPSNDANDGRDP